LTTPAAYAYPLGLHVVEHFDRWGGDSPFSAQKKMRFRTLFHSWRFDSMIKKAFSCVAILLVAAATVVAADVELKDVKCVVADKAADMEKSADYKGGKVYFCCGNCASKFAGDTKKFATKANHQLVATKQFEQKSCPFSGGDLNPETALKLAGVKVAFCCNNCKGKVDSAEKDAKKLELVFNDKAFAKGFKKKSEEG
jgi:YHS domain-containing protein